MDKPKNRDQELDQMLGAFRKTQPGPDQMSAWNAAVHSSLASSAARVHKKERWYKVRLLTIPQLAATLALGIIIGALCFRDKTPGPSNLAENSNTAATTEYIFANSN